MPPLHPAQILELADGDNEGDAYGKTVDDRFRNVADQTARADQPGNQQYDASHQRGDQQPVRTVIVDDSIYDNDERAGWSADLNPTSTKRRNQKSADDGGDKSRRRWRAGRDSNGNAQG